MNQRALTFKIIVVLSCGVVAISFSSIFTKMCAAPALTIALYRLSISSLLYIGIARQEGPILRAFDARQLRLALFSGLALALHFATWISSLSYTSVSSSTVLVVTSPVWVALGSFLFLREKTAWLTKIGIIITFVGSVVISGADFAVNPQALFGNVLAVAGAICAAVYLVIGRKLRADINIFPYVSVVYGAAALVALFLVLFTGSPLAGFDIKTFTLLFAIALLPQVVGHTSFNWALKYFSATTVAIVNLGEPIGASILAWLLLGERVGTAQFFGGVVILIGVGIALSAETVHAGESN